MDRRKIADSLLRPLDFAIGSALDFAHKTDSFDTVSDVSYQAITTLLRNQFKLMNELDIQGAHNVPFSGGVILASNHQSWLDVQVMAASCPRRVHFVAKSEFREWPVLRHLIDLSQSVFVSRGGDRAGMNSIIESLREGKAVAIYPEGTIPGEEDIPRHAVDPETGLLPGKTGAVRMALAAQVPVVPVGVSGTGRAFPPEIYPRLELLRLPGNTPVRIRFGQPLYFTSFYNRDVSKDELRELTHELMKNISRLVDHRSNYVPQEVPIADVRKHESVGVLLLHGFTSSTDTVDGLIPHLKKAGIPFERPVLRGHGTRYEDMKGVTARDWYHDAERALISLSGRVDRVIVVGLSMGGLVTLELADRHPDLIAGIVTVAAALKFKDPLTAMTPLLAKAVRYWPSPPSFHDQSLAKNCTNYSKFATDSFLSLLNYAKETEERLPNIHVPALVIAARKDQVVAPEAANIVYERISSPVREIAWFEKSGHEMMQDMEADAVFESIMAFVSRFREDSGAKKSISEDIATPGPAKRKTVRKKTGARKTVTQKTSSEKGVSGKKVRKKAGRKSPST